MGISFVFTPIYSIGNLVGRIVAAAVMIVSGVVLPDEIIDTVGLLTMVTLLLILLNMAKKVTWGIVTICWALIMIKIGLLMLGK
jgi:hypothetical protein